ncbi:hypothetical protein ACWIDS_16310 [Dietzia maris]
MNTTITTSLERRVTVKLPLLTVLDTDTGAKIHTALTPDERRALADALTGQGGPWSLPDLMWLRTDLANPTTAGAGQWTREDLPSLPDVLGEVTTHDYGEGAAAYRTAALAHLNAHHPKPEQTMVPARPVSPEERGELWARIRDELRGVYSSTTDQDHRKLDLAASASADTAVEYLNDRGGLGIDAREPLERALRERDEALRKKGEMVDRAVRAVRAERERDAAVARAEKAERDRDEADRRTAAAEADRDRWKLHHDRVDGQWAKAEREVTSLAMGIERAERERDEWKARAEHAEQLIPAYAMLDIWMALGRDSIHFDDWYEDQGYADAWAELTAAVREGRGDLDAARENAEHYQAMFDATERQRDEWKARAEKAEARTAAAVSRADIEKALDTGIRGTTDGGLVGQDTSIPSGECVRLAVDAVCDLLGIEAEQPADPVEEQTDALADILYGDELVTDQMRGVLERVVRAGMLFPEQEAGDE